MKLIDQFKRMLEAEEFISYVEGKQIFLKFWKGDKLVTESFDDWNSVWDFVRAVKGSKDRG
jgi:hypothetical protein